jgi:hypothetical protein
MQTKPELPHSRPLVSIRGSLAKHSATEPSDRFALRVPRQRAIESREYPQSGLAALVVNAIAKSVTRLDHIPLESTVMLTYRNGVSIKVRCNTEAMVSNARLRLSRALCLGFWLCVGRLENYQEVPDRTRSAIGI